MSQQTGAVREHDVTIADGAVAATVVTPDDGGNGAAVLFVHGLGSDRRTNVDRARALAATHAITCLAIDLQGHGDSAGRLSAVTPLENLADVLAAYDALAGDDAAGVDPSRIGVCGASYGAYLSVLLAEQRPVARLLLRAPALYADDVLGETLSHRRMGDAASARRGLTAVAASSVPTMLVESERDEVIPHDIVATYLAARPEIEHVVLPEAAHSLTDPRWRAQYERLVVNFFADLAAT